MVVGVGGGAGRGGGGGDKTSKESGGERQGRKAQMYLVIYKTYGV